MVKPMEGELRKRRTNPAVRLEVEKGVSDHAVHVFRRLLRIERQEIFLCAGFLDCRFLMTIADLPGMDHLRNPSMLPQTPPELEQYPRIWPLLRDRDLVIHHPYESF